MTKSGSSTCIDLPAIMDKLSESLIKATGHLKQFFLLDLSPDVSRIETVKRHLTGQQLP